MFRVHQAGKNCLDFSKKPHNEDESQGGLYGMMSCLFVSMFVPVFFFFFPFRAAPLAYGGSQARGQIGAIAAGLHHSSRQRRILNLLGEARDRTQILTDTSGVRNPLGHNRNSPTFVSQDASWVQDRLWNCSSS